jgi:hypothetical protein
MEPGKERGRNEGEYTDRQANTKRITRVKASTMTKTMVITDKDTPVMIRYARQGTSPDTRQDHEDTEDDKIRQDKT